MKRIGIVLFSNMRYAPYHNVYTRIVEEIPDCDYELIYLNRNPELEEQKNKKHCAIEWKRFTKGNSKFEKVYNFLHFRNEVSRILRNTKYDRIVVLTTMPSVLLSHVLRKVYKGKYLIDVRDYTFEGNAIYRMLEKRVFQYSALRIISSPGFVNFLPQYEYSVCHNIDSSEKSDIAHMNGFSRKSGRVVISYIGSIAYIEQCKKLMDLVANDKRFEFRLYGNEVYGSVLSDYSRQLSNDRITMMGAFVPQDKQRIYGESDIIFNCYGNGNPLLQYALSNKLYDAAFYKKPLLVSPDTMMAGLSGEFAYSIDLAGCTDLDGLYNWYQSMDDKRFARHAEQIIENANSENKNTLRKIAEFIYADE